jgi:hypothetical protein
MDSYSSDHTLKFTGELTKEFLDKCQEELEKSGICIISDLLTDQECINLENGCWTMLQEITAKWKTPINKNDETTWDMTKFFPLHHMLVQQLVSHSQVCWDARQNSKVVKVFQHLWDTEKLVTSFDGMSIHFPPEKTKLTKDWYNPKKQKSWIHCDQSYKRNELECYQAWVTPLDVNPGDATLVYLENSHLHHQKFASTLSPIPTLSSPKGNVVRAHRLEDEWYVLKEEDLKTYNEYGCKLKCVTCPKGSLVLWDSRTIHCGREPLKERLVPNMRICIYVCMLPRSSCSNAVLTKRKKYYDENRTTKHNPVMSNVFPKQPRIRSSEDKTEYEETMSYPTKAKLTALGKSLI